MNKVKRLEKKILKLENKESKLIAKYEFKIENLIAEKNYFSDEVDYEDFYEKD